MTITESETVGEETEVVAQTPLPGEEPDNVEIEAQSQADAEASLAKGFSSVKPEPEPLGQGPEPEEEAAPAEAIGDTYDMTPGEVKAMQKRLRRLEGKFGDINNRATGATPEQVQEIQEIKTELQHLGKLRESETEFEELTPVIETLQDLSARMDAMQHPSVNIDEVVREAVDGALLQNNHPDWREVSQSEEFRKFTLQGGPTDEEYREYAVDLQDPNSTHEIDFQAEWQADYPDWWEAKGKRLFGGDGQDQIALLDEFVAARDSRLSAEEQRESQAARRARRLRSTTTPQGVSADPATVLSDDEAFGRGFSRVAGKRR